MEKLSSSLLSIAHYKMNTWLEWNWRTGPSCKCTSKGSLILRKWPPTLTKTTEHIYHRNCKDGSDIMCWQQETPAWRWQETSGKLTGRRRSWDEEGSSLQSSGDTARMNWGCNRTRSTSSARNQRTRQCSDSRIELSKWTLLVMEICISSSPTMFKESTITISEFHVLSPTHEVSIFSRSATEYSNDTEWFTHFGHSISLVYTSNYRRSEGFFAEFQIESAARFPYSYIFILVFCVWTM